MASRLLTAALAAGTAYGNATIADSAVLRDYRAFLAAHDGAEGQRPLPSSVAVQWFAPFLSGGGYCSEALSFAAGLVAAQPGVRLQAVQHGDSYSSTFAAGLPGAAHDELMRLTRMPVDARRDTAIAVCHSEPGAWHLPPALAQRYATSICPPPRAAYRIGRTMFETDRLPSGWAERLNAMDEVWVPTAFARDVFAAGGVAPGKLLVVPEPVDAQGEFSPSAGQDAAAQQTFVPPRSCDDVMPGTSASCPYRFLSVGKFERRKGFDVLLAAFVRAFAGELETAATTPHVELYILTSAYHSTSDFDGAVRKMLQEQLACAAQPGPPSTANASCLTPAELARVPPIRLITAVPQGLLAGVYASVDALVQPSRGEGWGRPHVEAMAMGLPLVATHWSGPSEYLSEANGYPLRHTHLAPIPDGAFAGHLQAEPDAAELARLLRHLATHSEEGRAKGLQARRDMLRLYSPAAVGAFVHAHLVRIAAAVERPAQADREL